MNARGRFFRASQLRVVGAAIVLSSGMTVAAGQQMDHSKMHMPDTAPTKSERAAGTAPAPTPVSAPKRAPSDPHAGHFVPGTPPAPKPVAIPARPPDPDAASVDHAAMEHTIGSQESVAPVDHAAMGHEAPATEPVDHAAMGHDPAASVPANQTMDHAAMGHAMPQATTAPRDPIPELTDADRAAAFPDVVGHAAHDKAIHSYWLIDRLEVGRSDDNTGVAWEALGWVGTDLDRLWFRGEGERSGGSIESADFEVLYGRNVSRWWDLVAGVRHDFGEDPSQTFAGIGVIGLSPYKFEVEATAYVGQSGQTAARIEVEYDTLLTNRLILQWRAEADFYGRDDDRRGIGSGLGTFDAGVRVRYEINRQFAPFIGVTWERAFGGTADLRRADNRDTTDTRVVAGVRIWF